MSVRTLNSLTLLACVFLSQPVFGNDEVDSVDRPYSDQKVFTVLVGRIEAYRFVGYDEESSSNIYDAEIRVVRILSSDGFDLKKFGSSIHIYDIESTKKKDLVIVLRKTSSWRIEFWRQLDDVLCLDEKLLESKKWNSLAVDRLTKNCVVL